MKVIDLMQMYANKEILPKKIIIHDHQVFDEDTIWEHKDNTFYCREYNGDVQFLFEYIVPEMLNDEVEIIEDTPKEDKRIEKINKILRINDLKPPYGENLEMIWKNIIIQQNKINEIIDKIKGEE